MISTTKQAGPTCEVIVATSGNPRALELCLAGLARQNFAGFDFCLAEDGQDAETAAVFARASCGVRRRHTRQPRAGFGKNKILNAAIRESAADYLVFIDGDCLPAPGFVRRHLEVARRGGFASGGVVRLSPKVSGSVDVPVVLSGRVFGASWLRSHRCFRSASDWLKAGLAPRSLGSILERLSPVKRTWNGGNASGWRSDLLGVNGFDEAMGYGGEDVELGIRLNAYGVAGRLVRYTATLLHLHHERAYATADVRAMNRLLLGETLRSGRTWTPRGIRPGQA
jgi:glycosyltransferase involved in cell wall biosynthesis